jgi:hypothetical protein
MITVVNEDITTSDGWKVHLAHWRGVLVERVRAEELKYCNLIMTITHDWKTGEPLGVPHDLMLIGIFSGDTDEEVEAAKERYAVTARMMSVAAHCVGSIVFSEAWIAFNDKKAQRKYGDMPPRKRPDRIETLVAVADHRDFGPLGAFAKIKPAAGGKRTVGEWEEMAGTAQSRFQCILPRAAERDRQFRVIEKLAREHLLEQEGGYLQEIARSPERPRQ